MLDLPSGTSSSYGVYATYPPLSILKFNPSENPQALPPPSDHTLARPFTISPELYTNLLHVAWPASIATVYALTARFVNAKNKERNRKAGGEAPWALSKTSAFYIFVVLHNVGLAVFSGWTFIGMLNAFRQSWPGWDGEYHLAGAADALCKLNGPRGFGSAATYNMSSSSWGFTDRAMHLAGLEPDSADVGRIWNEGLAYYGFLFYLSKFYEVMDTVILLVKGKETKFLQTYHHTGAMLCMWAGIRYMSPPIWMFTFLNSGIHTLMYTYYTLKTLTIRVPHILSSTLTSMQITQIIFGLSYAVLHLFVSYDIPIANPVLFAKNLSSALPSAANTVSSAVASAATSAEFGAWLKKAALRAAGEEGLAENVRNYKGETFGIDAVHAARVEKAQEEIRYKLTTQKVHCLDTSGQVFAILVNAIYLAPLAYLFIKFFSDRYIMRKDQDPPKPTIPENIKKSAAETIDTVEKKISQAIEDTQGGVTEPPPKIKAELANMKSKSKQIAKDADESVRTKSSDLQEKVQQDLKEFRANANKWSADAAQKVKDAAGELPEKAKKGAQHAKDAADDASGKAHQAAGNVGEQAKKGVQNASDLVKDKTQSGKAEADTKANEASNKAKDTAADASGKSKKGAEDAANGARDGAQKAKNGAADQGSAAKDKAQKGADAAGKKAEEAGQKVKESAKKDNEDPKGSKGKGSSKGNGSNDQLPSHSRGTPEPKKKEGNGGGNNASKDDDGDARAYEVNPDEPKTKAEKKAEEKMQPKSK